jgi:4-amino-4-deoxy-L-arabinose transferase-like glycosyltransferase
MKWFFWTLVAFRALLNALIPLMDKTEARYAEISRIMAETQNWTVLQIDYGIPFWAKPPLSTWASAISMSLFGESAFFVRLPYLLTCVFLSLWIGKWGKKDSFSSYFPALILICIPEYYLHAGVVSTDVFLTFSTTLTMLSFWKRIQEDGRSYWGYLFFVGLGLGLLAKGPIVGILTLPPIIIWCLFQNKWKEALKKAPWILGSILMIIIALPWYIMTEIKSPGFFDYFIVGEHFNRYFNSEWVGDKYGFPKQQPFGIVWGFLLAFCLPWSILLVRSFWKSARTIRSDSWGLFLWIWILWTPLFFTTSTSLIHPYILPITIPLALWISHVWNKLKNPQLYLKVGIGLPLVILLIYLSGLGKQITSDHTDKYLVEHHQKGSIFALNFKSYSSQFYTNGRIKIIDSNELKEKIIQNESFSILINHKDWDQLPPVTKEHLKRSRSHKKRGIYHFN